MPRTVLFALSFLLASLAQAAPARSQHVEAELVSETASLAPGETGWLALRLKMDPHWHTYWVNPGEFGKVTEIIWNNLPAGVEMGEFHWPAPELYEQSGIINYVFEGEVFLLFSVKVPADFAGDSLQLSGQGKWLECDENECIPGKAPLSLTLPVKSDTPAPSKWAAGFAQARAEWPQPLADNWTVTAQDRGKSILINLTAKDSANTDPTGVYFFAEQEVTAPAEPQTWTSLGDGQFTLSVLKNEYTEGTLKALPGVLYAENGWLSGGSDNYLAIEPPLLTGTAMSSGAEQAGLTLKLIVLAFIGGMILNLMPCVFPVLGLKIMSFVNQGGESRGRVLAHGLTYTLGILISFWVLAGILLALRAGGQELGWGFQLQSQGFTLTMTIVLLVFALNMSGVFEVGMSAVGVGSNLTAKKGLSGSFFSGVLATLIATPCAAPFLATALGAALALPPVSSIILFTVIGLGLAFPYVLFSAVPQLAKKLPKPGAWMDTFKQLLAFLLYAAVAYLIWVLAVQADGDHFRNILLALVGVALACWTYGRFATHSSRHRVRGVLVALVVLVGSLVMGFYMPKSELTWQKWSPELVEQLVAEKRTIYVDFTARWCTTCQSNKLAVFSSNEVISTLLRKDVAMLKADWTNEDPAITKALESFGRSAIPFNLIYSPSLAQPLELPELLTPGIVLDALKEAEGN